METLFKSLGSDRGGDFDLKKEIIRSKINLPMKNKKEV